MIPYSVTDSPITKKFIEAVKLMPDFMPPSRRTLTRNADKLMMQKRGQLINLLSCQRFCATTADSWTAHNRSFIGMFDLLSF